MSTISLCCKTVLKLLERSRRVTITPRYCKALWHSPSFQGCTRSQTASRYLCSKPTLMGKEEIKREVDNISEKFTESMELLNDARNSMGTTYFSEDMRDAEKMIEETVGDFDKLLNRLDKEQRLKLTRSIGMKIEELKVQVELLRQSIRE